MKLRHTLFAVALTALASTRGGWAPAPGAVNRFATEVIAAQGPFGAPPYDDPASVLGMPATDFHDPWGAWSGGTSERRVKLVEPAYHLDVSQTRKLLTTLGEGSQIVVRFDPPITNDPAHPYGLDFLVFGNAFYPAGGVVTDSTDMNTLPLTGGAFTEPTKVSVSPGYTGRPGQDPADWQTWDWYRYENGPYADTAFPTQADRWDRTNAVWREAPMDFTKPVNPVWGAWLEAASGSVLSAADAIDLYDGSGGGTGFDLAESGFDVIRYVRVEGLPGFAGGEIDAFAAVRPMVLGDSLTVGPANLTNGTATLRFQHLADPGWRALAVHFTAVSDAARVATAPLTDTSLLAACGRVLTGATFEVSPALGSGPVTFSAVASLACGPHYSGDGHDLLVLRRANADWREAAAVFDPEDRSVSITDVTAGATVALLQVTPPRLALAPVPAPPGAAGVEVRFAAVPGWTYSLEQSEDLVGWEVIARQTTAVAGWLAMAPPRPSPRAFYRVRMARP